MAAETGRRKRSMADTLDEESQVILENALAETLHTDPDKVEIVSQNVGKPY